MGHPPGVVATFGDKTFSLSSGVSGNYEVSGDTVILSGMSLTGSYKIDGDKLVGDRFTFVPRDPDDKSSINQGPVEDRSIMRPQSTPLWDQEKTKLQASPG